MGILLCTFKYNIVLLLTPALPRAAHKLLSLSVPQVSLYVIDFLMQRPLGLWLGLPFLKVKVILLQRLMFYQPSCSTPMASAISCYEVILHAKENMETLIIGSVIHENKKTTAIKHQMVKKLNFNVDNIVSLKRGRARRMRQIFIFKKWKGKVMKSSVNERRFTNSHLIDERQKRTPHTTLTHVGRSNLSQLHKISRVTLSHMLHSFSISPHIKSALKLSSWKQWGFSRWSLVNAISIINYNEKEYTHII